MKKTLKKIRSKLVHAKLFSQRAIGYVSIINSGMILFLLLSNLEQYGLDIEIKKWFIPIFLGGSLILILIGYLEDRLGFFSAEMEATQKRNPQINEVLRRLDRIESKLKKGK